MVWSAGIKIFSFHPKPVLKFSYLQRIGVILGLSQKRCKNCHVPYFVSSLHSYSPTQELCQNCLKQIYPVNGKLCKKCGNYLSPYFEEERKRNTCSNCQKNPPAWDNLAFYGLYTQKLRDLLLSFKFGSATFLAPLFADFLLEASACLQKPDLLVAVPMYKDRLVKRGFNQAHEICKSLAKKTGFSFSDSLLEKIKHTGAQEDLGAYERTLNLKDSFKASEKAAKYNHIWLIDDIMTTGSTLQECCIQLKNSGANKISVLFVARTPSEIL